MNGYGFSVETGSGMRAGMRRRITGLCTVLILCILVSFSAQAATRWTKLKDKYVDDPAVNRLIFVRYKGRYNTKLFMYKKEKDESGENYWKRLLRVKAYVGENGIGKQIEGDKKTPTGVFKITEGFGSYKNPGLKGLKYTRLKWYHYWSAEESTYNTMVDVRALGRSWVAGEHLITYSPYYHYALVIGYNLKKVYHKGSGIFLHVYGSKPYTAGCVAVSEEDMIRIMKNTTKKTRICIYPK